MKTRKITVLLLMIPFLVMSQKEKNGKVFKNHPAIAIVNQFNKAYVDGDVEIPIHEFCSACMLLRGNATTLDVAAVAADLSVMRKEMNNVRANAPLR